MATNQPRVPSDGNSHPPVITMGLARCLPGPMFPSPCLTQLFLYQTLCFPCSPVPMFPRNISQFPPPPPPPPPPPNLPHPTPIPTHPTLLKQANKTTYIAQSLCYPAPMFPIFPSPNIPPPRCPQSTCSPSPQCSRSYFPQSLCSPIPMSPNPIKPQSWCSPDASPYISTNAHLVPMFTVPIFLIFFQSLCSPNMFPSPYATQSLWSPTPMSPRCVCESLYSQVNVPLIPVFTTIYVQSQCSPKMSPCL